MADKNDRPSAEYSISGAAKPERLSTPQFGPLVLGKVQAQKPTKPLPLPERKPRLTDIKPVHAPRNQQTLTGVAPPPKGTPAPPVPLPAPELDSTVESREPPRSLSPPPESVPTSKAERELAATRAQLQDARELLLELTAAVGKGPAVVYGEAPWWWTAKGVAAVLGASGTFVGLLAVAVVQIIGATKQPSVADATLRELVAERDQRKSGAELSKKLEEANQLERQRKDDQVAAALRELDLRYPAPKTDPQRAPNYN
jgi:hypothetical protein